MDAINEIPPAQRFVCRAELTNFIKNAVSAGLDYSFETLLPLLQARTLQQGPQTLILDGSDELKPFDMDDDSYVLAKHEFYKSLRPSPPIQSLVSQSMESAGISLPKCVGVHVRRFIHQHDAGDKATFNEDSTLPMFCKYMAIAAKRLRPECFYLITNEAGSYEALQNCRQDIKGDNQKMPPILSPNRKPDILGRGFVNGMQTALADMLLVSKTQLIIGSVWSSFSDEAALMGGISKVCVVDHTWNPSRGYHAFGARRGASGDKLMRLYLYNYSSDEVATCGSSFASA